MPEHCLHRGLWWRLIPTIMLVACVLLGCNAPQREADQWPISLDELVQSAQARTVLDPGETAYRRTCIACHDIDGRGNDQKTGADFTRPDGVLTRPDTELVKSIREGKHGSIGVMPPHGALLVDEEVTAVLAYVRRTFGKGIVSAPEPSALTPSASATPVVLGR